MQLFFLSRSSHWRCSVRKGVLRDFAKFTGKHPCQSLFFNKVAGLSPQACNFIKKETLAHVLSCEFCEISRNTFFTEHLWATAALFRHSFTFNSQFLYELKRKVHLSKTLCGISHFRFSLVFI